MTPLQQLESRIRELVPSLQELSFGCEVEEEGVKQTVIKYVHMDYDEDCSEVYTTEHPTTYYKKWRYYDSDLNKILGHPIQLHHVLQAIQLHYGFNDLMYYAGMRGCATVQLLKICGAGKECDWNLPLPLSGQSEKTIKFLLEILK